MNDRWQAVLDALRARFTPETDAEEIAAFLSSEGFDWRQIGEIVARFRGDPPRRADRAAATAGPLTRHLPPIRVLGPHERGRFAPEAWGQLVALHAGGVLTVLELERVIEHALDHVAGRIGLAELRAILEGIGLTSAGAPDDPVTIH
jgi:hypothetical protein